MKKVYTYAHLKKDIEAIRNDFPQAEITTIGKSIWGRDLFCIRLGTGAKKLIYNGAHHGMEWLTSAMLMRFVKDFFSAEREGKALGGFNVQTLSRRSSVYVVPMVNPDGVELSAKGVPHLLSAEKKRGLLGINPKGNFENWQSNARGVDLNHNYDAEWKKSKALEKEYGILGPGPTRFSGTHPESEPESHALAEFTRKNNFDLAIAFHSQGRVIYHGFLGEEPGNSLRIAKAFTKISPYELDMTQGIASYGGYKDWFVKEFKKPAYTVEVGMGKNPLPWSDLEKVYRETLPIMMGAMTAV